MSRLVLLLALTCGLARAELAPFTSGASSAAQYGVHEISLTGDGAVADPFATVATVTFTPPSGAAGAKTVAMFWDGADQWKARAYVTEPGMWQWASSSAGDAGLNGRRGTFEAKVSALRGMLKPHPANPRALATDNGQWFAPIGDTAYFLLGGDAYQAYVRDDWAQGVNFLRCSAHGQLRSYSKHVTEPGPGGRPQLASLQSDDARLRWTLTEYPGLYLQYILLPENAATGWTNLTPVVQQQWLQQVVARFGAFPTITWQIMNDSAYPTKRQGDTAVASDVADYLVAHDVYGHLRCTGARRGKGAPFADRAWTTFLHLETLDALAADEADRLAPLGKFTWCGEDRYETYKPPVNGRYFFRRLFWAWLLSGGSACYGGDWDAVVPYSQTGFSGLDSVRYIPGYLTSRGLDLALFASADELARDAQATGVDRPQVCRRGADEFLVYHPNSAGQGAGVTVDTARVAAFTLDLSGAPGRFAVEWFRCHDGVAQAGLDVTGGAVATLTAPWPGHDVVCRLTAR